MDYMDEFVISSIINIHMELSQDIEFLGLAKMASRGTTNQKVASSSLAGRTIQSTTYSHLANPPQLSVPVLCPSRAYNTARVADSGENLA